MEEQLLLGAKRTEVSKGKKSISQAQTEFPKVQILHLWLPLKSSVWFFFLQQKWTTQII